VKRAWRWLLPGAAAYLLFLVLNTPAAWLAGRLQSRLPAVQLAGVQGSAFAGTAAVARVQGVQIDGLRWRWRPLALFAGRLEVALEGRYRDRPLQSLAGLRLGGQPYLRDTRGRLDVQDLVVRFSRAPVELGGDLELALARVDFPSGGLPLVEGRLAWSPARLAQPLQLELGQVAWQPAPDGDDRRGGPLTARGGQLQVDGELFYAAGGDYSLEGRLRASGTLPDAVARALQTFAEYRDGTWYLDLSGKIPVPRQ